MFDDGWVVAWVSRDPTPDGGPTAYWQNAVNERFPKHARELRDQPNPIEVVARIEWERDGEEWVPGTAIRWDRNHVLVRIGDRRCRTIGVWLAPHDVRRRDPDSEHAGDEPSDAPGAGGGPRAAEG